MECSPVSHVACADKLQEHIPSYYPALLLAWHLIAHEIPPSLTDTVKLTVKTLHS